MGMACMENPLSLWHFYLRNKRKVLPVIGILALAILGVVVTDSLLASARETAYATFGSYQKLILVAPRATRDQDLANPLQDSLARLHEVQLKVDALDGPGGISSYYDAVVNLPAQVRAQLPAVQQLQVDAANARYYAARLRGDLVPLGDLIVRVQRLQSEEKAFEELVRTLTQNPNDPRPLITYVQQHQTWLQSILPDAAQLGRLQSAVSSASSDAAGLQQSLQAMNRDAANISAAGRSVAEIPIPPSPSATIDGFKTALDRLPDSFTVVGIIRGPTRLGVIPLDYMTQHYLFERRYQGLVVVPQPGHEQAVHDQVQVLIGDTAFRMFDWAYIKGKIDSLIANLDTINHFLILLVTIVLALVVGLLNNLFFRQRMNEFGLLAAVGYSRWGLILRVAWESLGVTIAAWVLGVGLGVAVLSWFNMSFMLPHGLLMNIFDWNVLALHTLPIPLMVFLFGMGTVAWQLLRLDPISIIERRD